MYEKTLKPFPKRLKSLEEKTWMFRGKRLSLFRVFHHRGHRVSQRIYIFIGYAFRKKLCETLCPSVVNSRFSQVIHDQPDFPFKEAVAVFVVIDFGQCLCQGGVFTHPAVEFLQGEHGGESRAVKLCKFGFGVRADDEIGFGCVFFFSLVHDFDYLIVTYCKCTEKYPECSVFLYSFFLKLCHRSSFFVIGASGVSYL